MNEELKSRLGSYAKRFTKTNYQGLLELAEGDEELVKEILESEGLDPDALFNPKEWDQDDAAIYRVLDDKLDKEPDQGEGEPQLLPNEEPKLEPQVTV